MAAKKRKRKKKRTPAQKAATKRMLAALRKSRRAKAKRLKLIRKQVVGQAEVIRFQRFGVDKLVTNSKFYKRQPKARIEYYDVD